MTDAKHGGQTANVKYFIQGKSKCSCGRESVDVVSRSDKEGLILSRHFRPNTYSFCDKSFGAV